MTWQFQQETKHDIIIWSWETLYLVEWLANSFCLKAGIQPRVEKKSVINKSTNEPLS